MLQPELQGPIAVDIQVAAGLVLRGVRDAERLQITFEKPAEDAGEPEVLAAWYSYFATEIAAVRVYRHESLAFLSAGAVSFAMPADRAHDFAQQLGLRFVER